MRRHGCLGFVHVLGPGHGKVLIGWAALASSMRMRRVGIRTRLSRIAQAGTAISLVGSLVFLFRLGSRDLVSFTETWLAPASHAAVATSRGVLIFRGARSWGRIRKLDHQDEDCGCGHPHEQRIEELRTLGSGRDALTLIASIAIRPCTGALFVQAIAARFKAFWFGALVLIMMGSGTRVFNILVAGSGVAARSLAGLGAGDGEGALTLSAALHVIGGLLIVTLKIGMLLPWLGL